MGFLIATIETIAPVGASAQVAIPQGSFTIPLNTTITVSTDKSFYSYGDTITILDKSSSYASGAKVTIAIENPLTLRNFIL